MSKGWYTIKDVMKDLEKVTGKKLKNLDQDLAVSGEHPPPVIISEDDDIMNMYGELDCGDNKIEPDLVGITNMLRMVNNNHDDATCNGDEDIEQLYKTANTVVSISKLNPNVDEFVPKSVLQNGNCVQNIEQNGESSNAKHTPTKSKGSHKISQLSNGTYNKESCETDFSDNKSSNNEDIDINKKIDVSNLNLEEIKCLKEKLKLKIIDTSKANCLKKKREKNLAIASLLKLHTEIPIEPKVDEPLKLMTPDYFQSVPKTCLQTESENTNTKNEDNSNICQNSVFKNGNIANSELVNVEINQTVNNAPVILPEKLIPMALKSPLPTTSIHEENDFTENKILDSGSEERKLDHDKSKEIKDSVRKVDDWLNTPEKQKHRASSVFLGPVTFKRKETPHVSPSAELSDRVSSVLTSDSFVPSTYADELTRNYMERYKVKEAHEDIWTKLERELKEKDKAIKEKM